MSRITTKELHSEIEQIKNNHLAHMAKDIEVLHEVTKQNRNYFEQRLDRLDNRIWAIVLLSLGTLLSTVIGIMI